LKYKTKMYDRLYRLLPSGYRGWVSKYITYADISISPEIYVGFSLLYGICLAFAGLFLFILGILPNKFLIPISASIFISFEVIMHGILVVISDNRTKVVEEIIPDALRLISANIRSGLTIDKALLVSARSEFGPLEKEIRSAAKGTLSGESIENALKKIADKFNSKILSRSMELLVEGIMRGGDVPKLLDSLGEDIRQIRILKKEVSALVMVYAIFIFFASSVGAPVLYAVSGHLVNTMTEIGSTIDVKQSFGALGGKLPLSSFKSVEITPEFLDMYSLLAMSVISIFGGILIGLIQEGRESAGLKFTPFLLIISLTIYFVAKSVVTSTFGIVI